MVIKKMKIDFILMLSEGLVGGLRGLIEIRRGKFKAYWQGIRMIRPNLRKMPATEGICNIS